jgi:Domain of unknown function (DUF4214)
VGLPEEAARVAFQSDIDCIIACEPPFFSAARWTGEWPKVICCDQGELPREMFRDQREQLEVEKRIAFSLADCVIRVPVENENTFTSAELEKSVQGLGAAIEALCLASTPGGHVPPVVREPNGPYAVHGLNSEGADRRGFYAMLRSLIGSELVDRAYLAILGRYADKSGRSYYIDQLSKGEPRGRIVWEIASSDEAKACGVCVGDVMAAAGLTYIDKSTKEKWRLSAALTKIWPGHDWSV